MLKTPSWAGICVDEVLDERCYFLPLGKLGKSDQIESVLM